MPRRAGASSWIGAAPRASGSGRGRGRLGLGRVCGPGLVKAPGGLGTPGSDGGRGGRGGWLCPGLVGEARDVAAAAAPRPTLGC